MSPKRTKSADEIFCRSCGQQIKQEAEICPNCGVRNEETQGSSTGTISEVHDPSQYETTVGPNWYYIVSIPTLFTIPAFALMSIASQHVTFAMLATVLLLSAVILPILGVYFDRQYIRANAEWEPSALWMVGFFMLYPLNVVLALLYLYRRHEVLGEP